MWCLLKWKMLVPAKLAVAWDAVRKYGVDNFHRQRVLGPHHSPLSGDNG
jgi:hypothetical protein